MAVAVANHDTAAVETFARKYQERRARLCEVYERAVQQR
jgi:hypothetical protein